MRAVGWLLGGAAFAFALDSAAGSPAFFVGRDGNPVGGDAAHVVIAHDGTRTVVSIQRDYRGPAADLALVIPVPSSVQRGNVNVLPRGLVEKVELSTAPFIVDAWEVDPCPPEDEGDYEPGYGHGMKSEEGQMGSPFSLAMRPRDVHGAFGASEYSIEVVSGDDATTFDGWLQRAGYHLPDAAHATLAPYMTKEHSFVVAKVDPKALHFELGRAQLSPIRFSYDGDTFTLPLALGGMDGGVRDLVIHVVARSRQVVEGRDDATPPVDVALDVPSARFDAFYGAIFEATLARHPQAFVTEFAGSTYGCEDCSGSSANDDDWRLLGFDVLTSLRPGEAVVTRLHGRAPVGDPGADVRFRSAGPIRGGTASIDMTSDVRAGEAKDAEGNSFRARYVNYHPMLGRSQCSAPYRGSWNVHPLDHPSRTIPARGFADASRGVNLAAVSQSDVRSLGLAAQTSYTFDPWRPVRRGLQWGAAFGLALTCVLVAVRRRRRA